MQVISQYSGTTLINLLYKKRLTDSVLRRVATQMTKPLMMKNKSTPNEPRSVLGETSR